MAPSHDDLSYLSANKIGSYPSEIFSDVNQSYVFQLSLAEYIRLIYITGCAIPAANMAYTFNLLAYKIHLVYNRNSTLLIIFK